MTVRRLAAILRRGGPLCPVGWHVAPPEIPSVRGNPPRGFRSRCSRPTTTGYRLCGERMDGMRGSASMRGANFSGSEISAWPRRRSRRA